jgi:hypothetical protein
MVKGIIGDGVLCHRKSSSHGRNSQMPSGLGIQIICFGLFLMVASRLMFYMNKKPDTPNYITWLMKQPHRYMQWVMFNEMTARVFILFGFLIGA